MKRTVPIFVAFLAVLVAGCAARSVQRPASKAAMAPSGLSATPSFTPPPSVEDEMRRKKTIGELWTAMNKHHDALGRLLQVRRTGAVVMGLRGDRDGIEGARRRVYKVKTRPARVTVRRPRVALQTKPTPALKRKPVKGKVGAGEAGGGKAQSETKKLRKFRFRYAYRRRPIRVCRRVCRHVKAICYASTRICRIASRLGELPAFLACKRSSLRCVDSRKSARKYCPPCR